MPSFVDNEKRVWELRVDVSAIRRVRDATGVDLGRLLADPMQLRAMQNDIVQFVDVLFAIVEPAARAKSVTAESFGGSLAGDALGHAIIAFEQAVVEFLPEPKRRAILLNTLEGIRAAEIQGTMRLTRAMENGLMEVAIGEALGDLDQRIANAMNRHRNPTGSDTGPH